jgi:flagellar P-ring protein FlgI
MRVLLLTLLLAGPAHADRIKDIATFAGVRTNQLVGTGIVVGLAGTGDDNLAYLTQQAASVSSRLGVTLPPGVSPGLKNAAAVMITAELPPFAKPGQRIDVTVAAIGKAKSLRGGALLMTSLKGADGQIYAVAQGSLAVGGLGAEGADGSSITVNVPSTGRIPEGATVERMVDSGFADAPALVLNLHRADFTTAQRVADAIQKRLGPGSAAPLDAVSVRVTAAPGAANRTALMSLLEEIEIEQAVPPARVVVNARSGTVVIGGNVRVLPVAVAHGSLSVAVTEDVRVSQPGPFSRGETVAAADSAVSARESKARAFKFAPGASLDDVVKAINALGATPGDLVAILEALRAAGALKAELVIL